MPVLIDKALLRGFLKHRDNDTHKGDYGHLLLFCGCDRMSGAAILSTGAALNSGCGLVTLHSTATVCASAASTCPSAIYSPCRSESIDCIPEGITKFQAIGAGPGIGKSACTALALKNLLQTAHSAGIPMVLDADALNIISDNPVWKALIPAGSILTPHDGELRRLLSWEGDEEKEERILQLCSATGTILISKGYRSRVFTPEGDIYVNTTGNPGMAKGGSGDVLTGLTAGLLARGYSPLEAALLGVWVHGYAGDSLTAERSAEAYSSADLQGRLWCAFKELYTV